MIETSLGTIRFEREYSKRRNRPVSSTVHFFPAMKPTKVAELFRKNPETALVMGRAISATARCWSSDNFCWREGNKAAISKVLAAIGLSKDQRAIVWKDVATQMRLGGKKVKK